jgi:hypothetical protein
MPQQPNPDAHVSPPKESRLHFSVEDAEKVGLSNPLYCLGFLNLAINCHLAGIFECVASCSRLGHTVFIGGAVSRS